MTDLTATRIPRSAVPRPRVSHAVGILAGAVGLALVLRFFLPLLEGPGRVDALRVVNPTDYVITVAAGAPGDDTRTPLGSVDPRDEVTFERIVDQGSQWVFYLRTQGHDAGRVERTEAQLEADDWQLRIPASVGDQLAAAGVPAPR